MNAPATAPQTVSFDHPLSIDEVTQAIVMFGETNTILVEGTPGIGKSSILDALEAEGYFRGYVDCANLSLGDAAMPVVDAEQMITKWAPNALFGIHQGAKVALMLDEFGKAVGEVRNMLLPLVNEHRLGSVKLPAGSTVFLTSNLRSDGLGDEIQPHVYNRLTRIRMGSPDKQKWQVWASKNNIDPILIAYVATYPEALACYLDPGQEGNTRIFNPKRANIRSFASPRSLARCSPYCTAYSNKTIGDGLFMSLIAGTVGEGVASEIFTLASIGRNLPSVEDIFANPLGCADQVMGISGQNETASVPDALSAAWIVIGQLIQALRVSCSKSPAMAVQQITAAVKFMDRIGHEEITYLFAHMVSKDPAIQLVGRGSPELRELSTRMSEIAG